MLFAGSPLEVSWEMQTITIITEIPISLLSLLPLRGMTTHSKGKVSPRGEQVPSPFLAQSICLTWSQILNVMAHLKFLFVCDFSFLYLWWKENTVY